MALSAAFDGAGRKPVVFSVTEDAAAAVVAAADIDAVLSKIDGATLEGGVIHVPGFDTPAKLGKHLEQAGFEWETINKADVMAMEATYSFTIIKDDDYGIIVGIQPDNRSEIRRKLPAAVFDACTIGGWTIGGVNTLKETADYLIAHGFVLNEKYQDKKWLPEIKGEVASSPVEPKTPPVCPLR